MTTIGRGVPKRSAGPARAALAAALLCSGAAVARAQEEPQPAIPARLAPSSLLTAGVVVDGRVVAVGERGHVLVSTDGGATWIQSEVPVRALLTGVRFHDERVGWAVGHDDVILKTEDGGASWRLVYRDPESERPLLDVWFADAERGFALGAYGAWLSTEDGGETWEAGFLSDEDYHLNAIAEGPDGTLWLAGEAGHLDRSDDGGATWTKLDSPYEGSFFGVLPLRDGAVLAFGLRGNLYRSEDRGESWRWIATTAETTLTSALELDGGRVIVAGMAGTVLRSADGGRSFAIEELPDRLATVDLVALADGGVLRLGEGGAHRLEEAP